MTENNVSEPCVLRVMPSNDNEMTSSRFLSVRIILGMSQRFSKTTRFFFLFLSNGKKYLILIGLKDVVGEFVKSNDVSKLSSMVSVEFGFL